MYNIMLTRMCGWLIPDLMWINMPRRKLKVKRAYREGNDLLWLVTMGYYTVLFEVFLIHHKYVRLNSQIKPGAVIIFLWVYYCMHFLFVICESVILNKPVQGAMLIHFRKWRSGKSEGTLYCLDKDSKSIPLSTILMIIYLREKAKGKDGGRGVWAEQQCEEKLYEQTLSLLMWKESRKEENQTQKSDCDKCISMSSLFLCLARWD